MTRTPPIILLAASISAAAACVPADALDTADRGSAATDVETTHQAISALSCPYSEVIVDQLPGQCSPLRADNPSGTWIGQPVTTYEEQGRTRMYCRYRWQPDTQTDARPPLAPFTTKRAQVDCPLVAPSGVPLEPAYWQPLEESFRVQAGRVKALPDRKPVTIAVIDSAIHPFEATGVEDNSPHGRAVGRAAFDLACGDQPAERCPVRIANHLALREVGRSKQYDPKNGGFYGTRGQLAQAIRDALEDWQKRVMAGDVRRLIINISLAWAQGLDGNDALVDGRTLPADVVFRTLRRASCLGALTVASAGNGVPPRQRGPMHPAVWESVEAPSPSECRTMLPSNWPFIRDLDGGGKYRPLVVSIGGVDHRDVVLSTARAGAQPRLVAPAQTVVTNDPRPTSGHSALLSGSSMAAAAASGALAAAWGHDLELPPHLLLERLYETAVPLDPVRSFATTEVCLGGSCSVHPVRRVSACALVESMVGAAGCSTVPAHAGTDPVLPPPSLPETLSALPKRCFAWPWGGVVCIPLATTRTGAAPQPTDEPWVVEQPGGACPTCRVHKNSMSMSGRLEVPLASWLGLAWGDLYTSIWGANPIWGLGLNHWFHASLPGSWSPPTSAFGSFEAYGVVGPAVWSEAFPLPMDEY